MPKFTIYASYTYELSGVEASSAEEVFTLLYDGALDIRDESEWGPDVTFEVECEVAE